MPLNTLRLNHQKSTHPNDRIVFIKPLPRPSSDRTSYDLADTFLRAIAAQCLPIMKNHFLSITTLEEHEPNREFIGRNFNNGEVIQLDEDEEEEDDDEEEGDEDGDDLEEDAVDLDGSKLLDSQGQGMVRVCDHEDAGHDVDAQHELEEMNSLDRYFKPVIQRRQQKQEQEQQQKRPASDQTRSNGDDYVKGKIGLLSNDAAERPTSPDLDQSRNEQDSFGMDTNTSVQRPTTSTATSRLARIVELGGQFDDHHFHHIKANKDRDKEP
ncbi:hypothetical protein KCU88_g494, partial [Aureobasidium melanogenum]